MLLEHPEQVELRCPVCGRSRWWHSPDLSEIRCHPDWGDGKCTGHWPVSETWRHAVVVRVLRFETEEEYRAYYQARGSLRPEEVPF